MRKWHVEVAPNVFSFVNNAEESVAFVSRVRTARQSTETLADLSNVTAVSVDALLALVADPADLQPLRGNLPRDGLAKQFIACSGFDSLVQGMAAPRRPEGALYLDAGGHKVQSKKATRAARFVAQFLGLQKHKPSRSILVECMANTNNHATDQRGEKPWKLWVSRDEKRGVVVCAFVDFGKGICRSLATNWAARLGTVDDGQLLAAALRGVTSNTFQDLFANLFGGRPAGIADHSSTGLHNRGYGLPNMLESVGREGVRRLVVLANHGYVEVSAPDRSLASRTLSAEFSGTIVCWEVSLSRPQST